MKGITYTTTTAAAATSTATTTYKNNNKALVPCKCIVTLHETSCLQPVSSACSWPYAEPVLK